MSLLYHNDSIIKKKKKFTHEVCVNQTKPLLYTGKMIMNQCKQNRLDAGTAFGFSLHSFHFQKIKKFVFLKATSCIYYYQTVY